MQLIQFPEPPELTLDPPPQYLVLSLINIVFGIVPLVIVGIVICITQSMNAGMPIVTSTLIFPLPMTVIALFFSFRSLSRYFDGNDAVARSASIKAKLFGGVALALNLWLLIGVIYASTMNA